MARHWLIGVMIVVPLIGIGVSEGLKSYSDIVLRREYRAQNPRTEESQLQAINMRSFCEEARTAFCDRYQNLTVLGRGAFGALSIGLGLLLVIWFGGMAARSNRMVLLRTFAPGLYVTAFTTIVLIAAHAVIAIVASYYLETLLIGQVHAGLMVGIAISAIAGMAAVGQSMIAALRPAETFVFGKRIERVEGELLYQRVETLARNLGALEPEHIVVGLDPSFFVTEAKVKCLNGEMTGRTMFCSLSLSRILTMPEFDAIIGHELGHYKGLDTRFSKKFYPIYRGTLQSLASLQQAGGGTRLIAVLPAIAVLSFFYEAFSLAESKHSRERELAADREGANVATRDDMASALVKVHAFSRYWDKVQQTAFTAVKRKQPVPNISKAYAEVVKTNANDRALMAIGASHTPHPTDSHPALDLRLQSLGLTVRSVAPASLNVMPEHNAAGLIAGLEPLEIELTGALESRLSQYAEVIAAIEASGAAVE